MKKVNYYLGIFLFFIGLIGFAQSSDKKSSSSNQVKFEFKKITRKNSNPEISNTNRLLENNPNDPTDPNGPIGPEIPADTIINPGTPPTYPSSGGAGVTSGSFAVSLSGGATYSVPITLPSGIKNIMPNIGISYNSQSSNGMVGWGWNVSGLSTITRISSTKYHDNLVNTVSFDINDRFALDGQRLLIKTGEYGAANSEYQTENYSNIKIKAFGVSPFGADYGPSYFVVYYPDGSRAYYGNEGQSRCRIEWAINKKVDPQGNYIEYNYIQSGGLLRINEIKYGANGITTSPNKIKFYYKTRTRSEVSFVGGYTFERSNILDRIEVKSNGILYRKYVMNYNTTSLGYQRLYSVREFNGIGQSFKPIKFTYKNTASNIITQQNVISIYPNYNYLTDNITGGDFDGDGEPDFIKYNKNTRNKLNVFTKLNEHNFNHTSIEINTSVMFDAVFANIILSSENKVLQKQGITTISETIQQNNSKVLFNTYTLENYGVFQQYNKQFTFPTAIIENENDCDGAISNEQIKIPKQYLSGDFNGDGLTDVIAIEKQYSRTICENVYDNYDDFLICECYSENVNEGNSKVYFMDLRRDITTNIVHNIGELSVTVEDGKDRIIATDFNGDGKTDIMHIRNGFVKVYTINTSNQLELIISNTSGFINIDKPFLFGDYNGDGKVDFTIPVIENSSNWIFYMAKGDTSFSETIKDIGIKYEKHTIINRGWHANSNSNVWEVHDFYFVPQDVNGDGKTDIIKHTVKSVSRINYTYYEGDVIEVYANKSSSSTASTFELTMYRADENNGTKKYGRPIFLESGKSNNNPEYAYICKNKIYSYEFSKDNRIDTTLDKISHNYVTTNIFYKNLDGKNDIVNTYEGGSNETYPNVNINISPGLKLVREVTRSGAGKIQRQIFKYRRAVSNIGGLGFLGYEEVKKTNWFGAGTEQLWNISKYDFSKRGAVIEQILATSSNEADSINKTNYIYSTQLLPNKVFVNVPTQIIKENFLQGVNTTQNYTYDSFYNPLTITNSFLGGSIVSSFEYNNNSSVTNQTYYIGRPIKKIEIKTVEGDSFSTEEQFAYNNNLVNQIKRKGNNTEWLIESFEHDNFGNLTKKTISATGITPKVEYFEYESTGRFISKEIDVEGLEVIYTYNQSKGTLLTVTDPDGLTTDFIYDGWQRLIKEINYLDKEINYAYNSEQIFGIGHCLTKVTDYPEGQDEKSYFNTFGWLVKSKVLSLNNKWIEKCYEYDDIGRKIRESTPYFSTSSPTQWNTISFDRYGRPETQVLFTGKTIQTVFNGLSVTVDDGTKIVTTTKNAAGNIVSVHDPGGTITYKYYGNGSMKSANYGDTIVTETIDGWGRKTALHDPSAGDYIYQYNILGELLEETTPKGITTYQYDNFGKLTYKHTVGEKTDLELNYIYDPTSKLLTSTLGENNYDNKSYEYIYTFDNYKRPIGIAENRDATQFSKQLEYDAFGRVNKETYNSTDLTTGVSSLVSIKNIFDTNGILTEIRDANLDTLLWEVTDENARGQATSITLGNGIIKTNQYDQYGLLTNITNKDDNTGVQALKMDYTFNVQRGILLNRKNYAFTNWQESFSYDNLNRLTQIGGATTKLQNYDNKGRITSNSQIGNYAYNTSKKYQLKEIDLNMQGDFYYQQHSLQKITYNSFKKPVSIYEKDKGSVDFEYGPMQNRTAAYYGGLQEDKTQRQFVKYYSSIIPVEIVKDNISSSVKIITYIGGSAYTAPIAQIKTDLYTGGDINEYHYLHRDYLGSILAITNNTGVIKEQAQFGAWGTVDKWVDGNGINILTGGANAGLLLGRGFTAHEHFFEVGLIHMNGRMYDAQLGRFLSPDNFIQDPYNTQSFNRYGYVWNNPLSYNDPSGEIVPLAPVYVLLFTGAWLSGISYAYFGNGGFRDIWLPMLIGAATSLASGALGGALAGDAAAAAAAQNMIVSSVISVIVPPVEIPIGDFTISVSPAIAFGNTTSFGANLSVAYNDGDVDVSAGFGTSFVGNGTGTGGKGMQYRYSGGVSYDDGDIRASLYSTHFDNTHVTNPHGGNTSQRIGGLSLGKGDFNIRYENDGFPFGYRILPLGDGNDSYRTAALNLSYNDYSIGFNLFTGERKDFDDVDAMEKGLVYGKYGEKMPHGYVKEKGHPYRLGALYFGYKNFRAGINSDRWVRHPIQDIGAHGVKKQPGFRSYSDKVYGYFQYQTYNKYTLW